MLQKSLNQLELVGTIDYIFLLKVINLKIQELVVNKMINFLKVYFEKKYTFYKQ